MINFASDRMYLVQAKPLQFRSHVNMISMVSQQNSMFLHKGLLTAVSSLLLRCCVYQQQQIP